MSSEVLLYDEVFVALLSCHLLNFLELYALRGTMKYIRKIVEKLQPMVM